MSRHRGILSEGIRGAYASEDDADSVWPQIELKETENHHDEWTSRGETKKD